MSLFNKQPLICCICGVVFLTDFGAYGGCVCSKPCSDEFQYRRTLYIMNKPIPELCKKPWNDNQNGKLPEW